MADKITVTFGGREVVLERLDKPYEVYGCEFDGCEMRLQPIDGLWDAELYLSSQVFSVQMMFVSPEEAVSVLESKLRQLRDELDKVLGDK